MNEIIKSALSQLKSNKLRTFLTMLGMFIGIGAVIIILSVGEGVKAYFNKEFSVLGKGTIEISTTEYSKENMITTEDLEILSEIPQVKTAMNYHNGYYATTQNYKKDIKDAVVAGIPYNINEVRPFEIIEGRMISETDEGLRSNVMVVDSNFSRVMYNRSNHKYALGKTVEINIGGEPQSFEIVGVIKSTVPSIVPVDRIPLICYIPFTTLDRIIGNGDGKSYDSFVIIHDEYDANDYSYSIQRILEKRHGKKGIYKVAPITKQAEEMNKIINTLNIFVSLVAAVSLVVGGIGIMNIMLVTVRERTREIGVRKALGATDKQILLQFLIEALILTVAGGIIGMIIGYLGGILIANLVNVTAKMTFGMIIFSVGTSSIIGLTFGVYPAYKAAKMDPVEALRFE